uniref:Uncharacterized protein n=1 Tax=Arundo donax TaxID=35708 RepID=A0A0A9AZL5_ARUDO
MHSLYLLRSSKVLAIYFCTHTFTQMVQSHKSFAYRKVDRLIRHIITLPASTTIIKKKLGQEKTSPPLALT